jgi:hypothetical protein
MPNPGRREKWTHHDGAHRHDEGAMPGSRQGCGPVATASTSRAIVSRGHGQVPNTSMDGQSMSTTNGLAWSQPRLQEGQNLAVDLAGAAGARLLWDQPRNPAGHRSSPG